MKKNTLKKLMALGCAAALVLSMTACSGGADTAEDTSSETTEETADAAGTTEEVADAAETASQAAAEYNIAIVKQMDHAPVIIRQPQYRIIYRISRQIHLVRLL